MKNKSIKFFLYALMAGAFTVLVYSCETQDLIKPPEVETTGFSGITDSSAICGGIVKDNGGSTVTLRGVCWREGGVPGLSDHLTKDSLGTGSFTSLITGLKPGKTYKIRAYATNIAGTSYGDVITFTTLNAKTVKDIDGNIYHSVTIGSQVWMTENLKVTHFNDGTPIILASDKDFWHSLSGPGYCWYNNDHSNKKPYGALYNSFVVSNGNLCPVGWHIPDDNDWKVLAVYLGGQNIAGGKLKEANTEHWISPNKGATNSSGFTALPGGVRSTYGRYDLIKTSGFWWSSTPDQYGSDSYNSRSLFYLEEILAPGGGDPRSGYSVRCIRDN